MLTMIISGALMFLLCLITVAAVLTMPIWIPILSHKIARSFSEHINIHDKRYTVLITILVISAVVAFLSNRVGLSILCILGLPASSFIWPLFIKND